MSKKNQKEPKKTNNLLTYFNKNKQSEDKNIEQPKLNNQCRKRMCPVTNVTLNYQQKSNSPPTSPKKHALYSYAKAVSIEQLLGKCPKLAQVLIFVEGSVSVQSKIVKSVLKKYLQSNSHSLWSGKYAPNDCSELFNVKAGHKIKDWLYAYFEYKNQCKGKICEQSDSFLNDFEEQKSCKIYNKIKQNQWRLDALVVRGKPGIGKSSAVRAIAKEMNIDLQECGNHYNQTKYLREKNESTQSESVKTAISRKNKLQKNAQMITKFMTPVEKEKANQNKKSQLIHNVGQIYPETQADKFYSQLKSCVGLSKIPFILTDSCQRLPKECQNYDVIQFQYGQRERIQQILWIIYHLENVLQIDTLKLIQKENLFSEINTQLANVQIKKIESIQKIHKICCLYNYRLDYIFTYLQQQRKLEQARLKHLFIEKYKCYTKEVFMDEISLINETLEEANIRGEKSEDNIANTQDSQEGQKTKDGSFHQYLQKLNILRMEDTIKHQGQMMFQSGWEQDYSSCINNNIHRGVKKDLIKKIHLEVSYIARPTLRISELSVLPMLIKQKRASRNSKASDDAYHKFFNENQCVYIKKFCSLIKNQ